MKKNSQTVIKEYLMIVIGTGLIAFAVASIYDPSGFVTGGFSGLAIIVKQLTEDIVPGGVSLAVTNFVLNIPVFLIAIRLKGWRYIVKTVFGTVILSIWLAILPVIPIAEGDFLLTALYGGVDRKSTRLNSSHMA